MTINMFQKTHEITPPCQGIVSKIHVKPESHVYEWELLFSILEEDGKETEIEVGASGIIRNINVAIGDKIYTTTVLAEIEDDMKLSGCD